MSVEIQEQPFGVIIDIVKIDGEEVEYAYWPVKGQPISEAPHYVKVLGCIPPGKENIIRNAILRKHGFEIERIEYNRPL